MSEADDRRPALSPQFLWRVLVGGNLTSLAVILFVFHRMMSAALSPELGLWLFIAGLVLAVPAFIYQRHAKSSLARAGLSENARQLKQLHQVVIACALAELPGLLGTVYYLFTADWTGTVLLLAVTAVLLLQAQPHD